MKKTISAKRVLSELIFHFNEQHEAFGYAKATGNHEVADQCQAAIEAVCEMTRNLGFNEGADYSAKRIQKTVGDVTFCCWEREAVQA